jgi:hypothetical protein
VASPLKNIVWIASYPKSGNTWVRFMACNLLFGRQESASTIGVLAPDIHEMGPRLGETSQRRLVKTHFAYSATMPLADRTAGAIYVVRRPEDVLVSNFYYTPRSDGADEHSHAAFDRYVEDFIHHRGDPRWLTLGMGSWEGNVRSWLRASHAFPIVAVRYEDLSSDPQRVCRSLAQVLGLNSSAEEIHSAVANSSFGRMREIEETDIREKRVGIFYKPHLQQSLPAGSRFMRQGSVGEGAQRLTDQQQSRLTAAFAPLLAELNYPTHGMM